MNNPNSVSTNTIKTNQLASPNQNIPIHSNALFAYSDVVLIQHQDDQYYLRRTRNGKLILTK